MLFFNIAGVGVPDIVGPPSMVGKEFDTIDDPTFIDWIIQFFTSIWEFLNNIIDIFTEGMEGAKVILGAMDRLDEVYSFCDFYFPAGVTICIFAVLSMAICIVTFKIVTAFVG